MDADLPNKLRDFNTNFSLVLRLTEDREDKSSFLQTLEANVGNMDKQSSVQVSLFSFIWKQLYCDSSLQIFFASSPRKLFCAFSLFGRAVTLQN